MNKIIGTKINWLRKQQGWSLEYLSARLHISKSALQRMEKGETAAWASHLDDICALFGVAPDYFFQNKDLHIGS